MNEPPLFSIIRQFPDGTVVPAVRGTVKKVFDQRSGENGRGPWSLQNLLLEDAAGEAFGVMLKDREPFPFRPGETVTFEAHQGDKQKTGVYAFDDTYQGNTERKIKITPTAEITVFQGGGTRQQAPAQKAPQNAPESTPATQHSTQAPPTRSQSTTGGNTGQSRPERSSSDDLRDAKRQLVKIANLHLLCARVVETIEAPTFEAVTGKTMDSSQVQAAVASVFIKAERMNLVEKMPTRPLTPEDFVQ